MANSDNPRTGAAFEELARSFFLKRGLALEKNFAVEIGIEEKKKQHKFDLGCFSPATIVECKSHTWTSGGNAPSAKLSVWNEAMYYFFCAPAQYSKKFIVLLSEKNGLSLLRHYLTRFEHLVPQSVEIWEYNPQTNDAEMIKP